MELGADDYLYKSTSFDAFVAAAHLVCEKMAVAV
jgi:DNA-binding NarL/FixJ family response regulator